MRERSPALDAIRRPRNCTVGMSVLNFVLMAESSIGTHDKHAQAYISLLNPAQSANGPSYRHLRCDGAVGWLHELPRDG